MSLLMDALRRAEKEKKAQQERAGDAGDVAPAAPQDAAQAAAASDADPGRTRDARLDIGGETTAVSPQIGSEDATIQIEPAAVAAAEAAAARQSPDSQSPDSHSPDSQSPGSQSPNNPSTVNQAPEDHAADRHNAAPEATMLFADDDLDHSHSLNIPAGVLELEAADQTGADSLALEPMEAASVAADETTPAPADLTGGTTVGVHERHEQTATMPSTRAVESDLDSYFDQSQSIEAPRRPARGDLTLEDVAAHTVVNANTVFAASERKRSRPVLLGIAVVAVLVVLGIGAVGLFYAQQSATPRYIPPPTVADGVEQAVVRELPIVPLEPAPAPVHSEPPTVMPAVIDTAPVADAAIAANDGPAADAEPAPPLVDTPAASLPQTATAAAATPVDAATADETIATGGPAVTPQPAPASAAETTPVTPAPSTTALADVNAGEVRIARSRGPSTADTQVTAGYSAFQAGNFAAARLAYEAALIAEPDQRDALLGLGAIALREGNNVAAYDYYARVLDLRPDDVVASTALFGLAGGNDAAGAARLRLMLDRFGETPQLHFALGNWYARQNRWGDAQQAYFDAMRLDDANPDYAYNLAISLDHLGQSAAAVAYYQKSLGLADETAAGFSPDLALSRIQALSSVAAGE